LEEGELRYVCVMSAEGRRGGDSTAATPAGSPREGGMPNKINITNKN
jgi:hypothetical protein